MPWCLNVVDTHRGGYFIRRQYQRFAGYRGRFEERLLRRAESFGGCPRAS